MKGSKKIFWIFFVVMVVCTSIAYGLNPLAAIVLVGTAILTIFNIIEKINNTFPD